MYIVDVVDYISMKLRRFDKRLKTCSDVHNPPIKKFDKKSSKL